MAVRLLDVNDEDAVIAGWNDSVGGEPSRAVVRPLEIPVAADRELVSRLVAVPLNVEEDLRA